MLQLRELIQTVYIIVLILPGTDIRCVYYLRENITTVVQENTRCLAPRFPRSLNNRCQRGEVFYDRPIKRSLICSKRFYVGEKYVLAGHLLSKKSKSCFLSINRKHIPTPEMELEDLWGKYMAQCMFDSVVAVPCSGTYRNLNSHAGRDYSTAASSSPHCLITYTLRCLFDFFMSLILPVLLAGHSADRV